MTPPRTSFLAALLPSAVLFGGCQTFGPPQAATRQAIAPMPVAAHLPARFEVELATPMLSGVFDAVFRASDRGFALQLFPDVGGKVFDLRVGPARVDAETPAGSYHAEPPLDQAAPHLALVLAVVFAELLAPVDGARVLGERALGDGRTEVQLAPALGGGLVAATLARDGHIAAYRCELGWLQWTFGEDGSLESSRFTGALRLGGS